jgi:hypothetical protein
LSSHYERGKWVEVILPSLVLIMKKMVWRWWSGLSFPFFYFFEREREKRTRGKWLCLLMLSSKFTNLTIS